MKNCAKKACGRGFDSPQLHHQYPKANLNGWPFFLPAPRVLARICGWGLRVNPFHVASFAASLASLFSTFCPVPVEDSWGLSLP